jgi:hypothetical protein
MPDFDYGQDTDRETELKRMLVELEQRYREEAKPLLDELVRLHSLKTPRVTMAPEEWAVLTKRTPATE